MSLLRRTLFLSTLFPLVGGHSVWAYTLPNPLGFTDIPSVLCAIAEGVFGIALAAAVIAVLLAAYFFLTSGGNEKKVTRAKEALHYAVYGAIVVLLSWGGAFIVATTLGGTGSGLAGC